MFLNENDNLVLKESGVFQRVVFLWGKFSEHLMAQGGKIENGKLSVIEN